MAFRGYFAIDGVEIANSSRVIAHLGKEVPTTDVGIFDTSTTCSLVEVSPGMYELPADAVEIRDGLYAPFNGARRYDVGLLEVDDTCWGPASLCAGCRVSVVDDDSWSGLREFLDDPSYRPELAPWFSTRIPESGEFGGVWVMDVQGLGPTPVSRDIVELAGHGAMAGPYRDSSRKIAFEALLIGCTNAGVEYGLSWLSCLLRSTNSTDTSVLRYFNANPTNSAADPSSLVREVHGLVLTSEPKVTQSVATVRDRTPQATMYRVTWEMVAVTPWAYLPTITVPVDWDAVTRQPVNWIHAADCHKPSTCLDMPVMFSATCVPESIDLVQTPPPVCGGCMPVGGIDKYSFRVPTFDYAQRCTQTAVSTIIRNNGDRPLTLQAFWRACSGDIRCEDNQFPLQVSGLPTGAELVLDGITGRFWANYDERRRRAIGVVGTPTGAPWRPPIVDRSDCWDFVVQAAEGADFDVVLQLADRDA